MKRRMSLSDISNLRLYDENDMVKADCMGCQGCFSCCQGMGESVILDPFDVYRLTVGLQRPMQELLASALELNVVDGVVLPNLRMSGVEERCVFLNGEGRCSIYSLRPGICRIFPLGRYYENGSFRYFLQTGECTHSRSKVKVGKWIDTPDYRCNREFVTGWHYLVNQAEILLRENGEEDFCRNLNLFLLNTFYMAPYDPKRDFYEQFEEREARYRETVPEG